MSHQQDSIADPRNVRIQELADTIEQQAARIQELEEKLEQLRALLDAKAESKGAKKPDFTENYSLGRNKLQNNNKKKRSECRLGRNVRRHRPDR